MKHCKTCNTDVVPILQLTPEKVHHGKNICPECGAFIDWASKPKNENVRTKTSRFTIEGLNKDCCELCRRHHAMLGNNQTLEIHHKDCNAENDVSENLLVLCTQCHKAVHSFKTYMYDHWVDKFQEGKDAGF